MLGVYPHLEGKTFTRRHVSKVLANGQSDLLRYQIHSRNDFRHTVFHLCAGIHLQKAVVRISRTQGLDSTDVVIAQFSRHDCSPSREFEQRLSVYTRRRCFFDNLLTPALDGTLPLKEMTRMTVLVGQDLKFDVARRSEPLFQIDAAITEAAQRLLTDRTERVAQRVRISDDAHPDATPTGSRFQHERITNRGGSDQCRGHRIEQPAPREHWKTALSRQLPSSHFVTKCSYHRRSRSDKRRTSGGHRFSEVGVLREKTIPRVHVSGTGFGKDNSTCTVGGGTFWLTTAGNIVPGGTLELRIVVWDVGDHILDSLAVLDGLQWLPNATVPGTDNN